MTFWKIRLHKYVQNGLKIWGTVEISVGFWFCLGSILFFRKLDVSWQQVCKAGWAGQPGEGLSALTLNCAWASQVPVGSGKGEMGKRVVEGFFWPQIFCLGWDEPHSETACLSLECEMISVPQWRMATCLHRYIHHGCLVLGKLNPASRKSGTPKQQWTSAGGCVQRQKSCCATNAGSESMKSVK